MSLTASRPELRDRLDRARAMFTVARERAAKAVAVAVDVTGQARHARLDSIGTRSRRDASRTGPGVAGFPRDHAVRSFRVAGDVDGAPCHARWSSERGLECSPSLRPRIEIVVALGETFDPGDGRPVVQASLDGPVSSVLPTVIRAFTRVTSIELAAGRCTPRSEPS
jgi:hypothetical protein